MIEPEKKNRPILGYTTKTKRAWFHTQSKKLGFASTSKMILQALEFLIKTMNNGITMNTVKAKNSKDPIWNGWSPKSSKEKINEIMGKSPKGLLIQEIKSIFKAGKFQFVKYSDTDLGVKDEIIDHRIKEEYRNTQAEDLPHAC